jgi:hypothetical protein
LVEELVMATVDKRYRPRENHGSMLAGGKEGGGWSRKFFCVDVVNENKLARVMRVGAWGVGAREEEVHQWKLTKPNTFILFYDYRKLLQL